MANCFYCGKNEKLTKAHLFQKYFRQVFTNLDEKVSISSSSASASGVVRDHVYRGDMGDTKVTSLCRHCNNDWMKQIEEAAAPHFEPLVKGERFPEPAGLFKLAHWAVVMGALSSEIHNHIDVPLSHRRTIRNTRTGQPAEYGTYFIVAKNYYDGLWTSFYRGKFEDRDDEDGIFWVHKLHAGNIIIITATPNFSPRVAGSLESRGINSIIGAISSNLVYTPRNFSDYIHNGQGVPTHDEVNQLMPTLVGSESSYVRTQASEVIDFSDGINFINSDLSFDFTGRLVDFRDSLDLTYLDNLWG